MALGTSDLGFVSQHDPSGAGKAYFSSMVLQVTSSRGTCAKAATGE